MCGSVGGGGVCYSGDSVGSVAVYFCDDGYTLQGSSTRECLSTGLWNGTTPHCIETDGMSICIRLSRKQFLFTHRPHSWYSAQQQ